MKYDKNAIEDGCAWCGLNTMMDYERFARKKLQNQLSVCIQCPECGFSNAIRNGKYDNLRVYAVDTTYYRKLFKSNPRYVESIKNIHCSDRVISMLSAKAKTKPNYQEVSSN